MWSQPRCFFLGAGGHPPVLAFCPFLRRLCSSSYCEVSLLVFSLPLSQCSGQRAPRERRIVGPLYRGCGAREAAALGQLPVTSWCVAASAADWLRGMALLWGAAAPIHCVGRARASFLPSSGLLWAPVHLSPVGIWLAPMCRSTVGL